VIACCALSAATAQGAETHAATAGALKVLETHCVACHGGGEKKGGLDLSTRESLLRGGECGDSIDLEKPDDSYLMQMVRHEADPPMPFKKPKLNAEDIALLSQWIKAGAQYDRILKPPADAVKTKAGFEITDSDRNHWAFQPLVRPPVPATSAAAEHPLDRFILAKLEAKGLSLSPETSREVLIRRVTFDLIGLPPTPEEIDKFVNDSAADAYEQLIERLLASPHYGERWGRHWLDLARYAETDGFEHDAVRPNSWRYRDYVIRALNADKPYDRFIREQLAGDELWPGDVDALIATGFNLLGPDMVDSSDQIQRRVNTLNDMTDTTSLVFLGLTLGCARCHDHKFEPLSQKDYYSLQAHFVSAKFDRNSSIASAAEKAKHAQAMHKFKSHPLVRELSDMEQPVREKLRRDKMAKLSPEALTALETPPEKRTTEQTNLALETEPAIEVSDDEMLQAMDRDIKERRKSLLTDIKKLPRPPALSAAVALADGPAAKAFVLNRGEYTQPGEEVKPRYPEVLALVSSLSPVRRGQGKGAGEVRSTPNPSTIPEGQGESSTNRSRASLAEWIASPDNPLTARVMINRIWKQHFGQGLVATPSNFGTHGLKPSHPELLDWLASEFVDRGYSIKQMHRLMLTSRTYRQVSTAANKQALKVDRENTLYWRMNRLRLEGEAIRDSLLAVSGELNPRMGGPGVFPPLPAALFKGSRGWEVSPDKSEHVRRSVYIFARRNLRFPFLEVFDAPDNNLSCPSRERSTTAPQSLTLLNSSEVTAAADALTDRLTREAKSDQDRIVLAYRLALGRMPTASELKLSQEFLAESPLEELCRALFNMNDFVYVE
jgi:mono/diheme cytochrome c family protein